VRTAIHPGLALAGIGVVFGALGCIAVRRVLSTLLFGIGPNDPATLTGARVRFSWRPRLLRHGSPRAAPRKSIP